MAGLFGEMRFGAGRGSVVLEMIGDDLAAVERAGDSQLGTP